MDLQKFGSNLKRGKSGIRRIDDWLKIDKCNSKLGGIVENFNPLEYMDKKAARRMDRFAHFSIAAARMAIQDAKLSDSLISASAAIMGTAVGGFPYGEEQHTKYLEKGLDRVDPLISSRVFFGSAINQTCIELGIQGITYSVTTGCAASADAIGLSYWLIKNGHMRVALAGGADAPFSPLTFSSFYLIGVMSEKLQNSPSPFDVSRDGIVLSEGGAYIILEERDAALSRGAEIYAEIVGYGTTHDAYHAVQPAPDGASAKKAIKLALSDAGLEPKAIDHIMAHGCGTKLSDEIESEVISEVFREAERLTVTGMESMIGHPLGAIAAMKVIGGALSIRNNIAYPTINLSDIDPKCRLNYVPNKAQDKKIDVVMVNAFSFGGKNSILILRRHNQ
jgi:3-oxoacyl-[acyl-carrier-protein] synthase II